jgi:uncharacterized damage-inducible protein DinB
MSTAVEMVRSVYDYHGWANHRLFAAARELCPDVTREVGKQFSFPTVKGLFAHIVGADRIWLDRFKGKPVGTLLGDADFASMDAIRVTWEALEDEQREFVASLTPADLARPVHYTSGLMGGRALTLALGGLLLHVANHGTHHRSEIATMITMLKGSPPGTDRVIYELMQAGQIPGDHTGWR